MILGITGGICAGKSIAAEVIATQGVRVVDCDEIARYLSRYDTEIIAAIQADFGARAFQARGALDRAALAAIIFEDADLRQRLEAILHPAIKDVVHANIDYARSMQQPLVIVAPLLIEAGLHTAVDRVWVISCTPENQLARLRSRRNVDPEQAQHWIDAQMPQQQKESHADTVLHNDGSIAEFEAAVLRQWQDTDD